MQLHFDFSENYYLSVTSYIVYAEKIQYTLHLPSGTRLSQLEPNHRVVQAVYLGTGVEEKRLYSLTNAHTRDAVERF